MSSPTVMFVLEEVVRSGDPRPGDWGVMIVLGPGMAAEVALLKMVARRLAPWRLPQILRLTSRKGVWTEIKQLLNRRLLARGGCKKDWRESLPPGLNGNRALAIAGDLRRGEARHCRLAQRRPPVVCRIRRFDRRGRPIAFPPDARFVERRDIRASRQRSLRSLPSGGEPSDLTFTDRSEPW